MFLRSFDLIFAGFGLLVLLPAYLLIIIACFLFRLPSPMFSQIRVGRYGKEFTLYKVRTMHRDTKNMPTHLIVDPVVSRIGKVLRITKLDELPQLWNVFIGDMSLVGPRPCLPSQNELIYERRKRGVFDVRPGVTGLAQLSGIDMSAPKRLAQADVQMIQTLGLFNYFKYLALTVLGRGLGDRSLLQ